MNDQRDRLIEKMKMITEELENGYDYWMFLYDVIFGMYDDMK